MPRAQITDPRYALEYVLAGRGRFTIVSVQTGTRFTYKIESPRAPDDRSGDPPKYGRPSLPPLFVKVLMHGSEEYGFIGFIRGREFKHSTKAKVGQDAPSFRSFNWLFQMLIRERLPSEKIEFWHEGKCGKCGRVLTVPESIERGLGPICARR